MPSLPLGKSENIFWQDTLLKMGFQTYIFCSKVPSKCRKCRFRDPNFKMGFQTYIFCSKVPSKCRKCRFVTGFPLTKILATPLDMYVTTSKPEETSKFHIFQNKCPFGSNAPHRRKTRSYYRKWSAALQYLTRLAQCAIECESIVLVCITFNYIPFAIASLQFFSN